MAEIRKKKIQTADSHRPLPMIAVPKGVVDLTGKRQGKLVVKGFASNKMKRGRIRKGFRWVVQCDCGIYTERKSLSITKASNTRDSCERCREEAYQRNRAHYDATGEDLPDRGFS